MPPVPPPPPPPPQTVHVTAYMVSQHVSAMFIVRFDTQIVEVHGGAGFFVDGVPAGLYPVSLVHLGLSQERAHQVHTLYGSLDAAEAWMIARALGIDYVYLDAVEKSGVAVPALDKFEHNSQYFVPVFRNAEVVIFSVVTHGDHVPLPVFDETHPSPQAVPPPRSVTTPR